MRALSWRAKELLSSPEALRSMALSLQETRFSFEPSSRSASRRHLYRRAGERASCMIVNAFFSQVSWCCEDVALVPAVCNGPIHSFSILSNDRSKASSKTIPPHSAI